MTSNHAKDFAVFIYIIVKVMADLQPYRIGLERVSTLEDSKKRKRKVNDWLEGTVWCTCEGCEIMLTQRECVCCCE